MWWGMSKINVMDSMFKEIFFGPNYDFYYESKVQSIDEYIRYCSSNRTDEEKAAQLLFNLIILDKRRKYPTTKEMLKAFLQSNASKESKKDVVNFILNENYMNPAFVEDFGNERVNQRINGYSKFMSEVTKKLNIMTANASLLFVNFDFVAREAVQWLIKNSSNPKNTILSLFKEKTDWMDIARQNGILDYCYNNAKFLGKDFVLGIIEKSIKTNMREVRLVAYRYAYWLIKDEKYIQRMSDDPSGHIRRKIDIIKSEKAR